MATPPPPPDIRAGQNTQPEQDQLTVLEQVHKGFSFPPPPQPTQTVLCLTFLNFSSSPPQPQILSLFFLWFVFKIRSRKHLKSPKTLADGKKGGHLV